MTPIFKSNVRLPYIFWCISGRIALLANCRLLDDLYATTHHNAIELLRESAPKIKIVTDKRFVDNGKIILSAGVFSGIDMSFYIIKKLLGEETSNTTARRMEYDINI